MREIDKRSWICTNVKGNCLLAQKMSAALCQGVPADRKCPLCKSEITIFGEVETKSGIIEFIPEWKCLGCGYAEPVRDSFVPLKCPRCGSEKIDSPPIKKDDGGEHPYKKY